MQQPITPLIMELTEPATEQITVGDVLLGAFSVTGMLAVAAVVLAVFFALALVWLKRVRPENALNGEETARTRLGLTESS